MWVDKTGPVIFFASAAIILYEITLSRIFSVLMWYHFVSFAVALALCGMAAGSLLSVRTGRMTESEAATFMARFLFFSSFALLLVYLLFFALSRFPSLGYRVLSPLHQTYYEPFAPSGSGGGISFFTSIALILIFLSFPFLGGGAVFAACFERSGNAFKTYCGAMAGSAAGVVLYLIALETGSGPLALLIASLLFSLPLIFLRRGRSRQKSYLPYLLFAALFLILGNDIINHPAEPKFVRGRYVPDTLWTRWDAVSRVAVYPISDDELLRGFGQGSGYRGNIPEGLGMVVDDTGYTGIFGGADRGNVSDFFRYNIASLPYHLKKKGTSLIIGPGGGKDIYCALASGDFAIDAVEVNKLVLKGVQKVFGDFSGRPYTAAGVNLFREEGRAFLERKRGKYDVIQMTQVFGRVPPQAGAFTLTENHLYTVEAIGRMLDCLNEGGILSITRFSFEKTGPRLVNTIRAAMIQRSWETPEESFLIAGSRGIMNVLAVRGKAGRPVIEAFQSECDEKGFEVLYAPGKEIQGQIGRIITGRVEGEGPGYDISPATDDRPFFYYTLLPRDFLGSASLSGKTTEEKGAYLIRTFLLFSLVISLILPIASVLYSEKRMAAKGVAHFYSFLLAGMGFISVEIILIKKLILPLGFPVYSLSCILLAIFILSAIGSMASSFIPLSGRNKVVLSSLVIAGILVLYWFALDRISLELVKLSPLSKYVACFLIAGLPGLFMGVPFPALLSIYNNNNRGGKSLPVAVNGFASVTGSMLVLAVSMNLGYGASFLLAGGIYGLVALCSLKA